jgi:hypothetical protein
MDNAIHALRIRLQAVGQSDARNIVDGNLRTALQQSGAMTPLSATTIKNSESSSRAPRIETACE